MHSFSAAAASPASRGSSACSAAGPPRASTSPSADLIVGTSAGSVVGAQLRLSGDLQGLYERQLLPPVGELKVEFDGVSTMAAFADGDEGQHRRAGRAGPPGRPRPPVDAVPEAQRRAIIEGRIGDPEWPTAPAGHHRRRHRRRGVPAVRRVLGRAAARRGDRQLRGAGRLAAGHRERPPADGRRHAPVTNADLAAGCEKVLVVTPTRGMPGGLLGPGAGPGDRDPARRSPRCTWSPPTTPRWPPSDNVLDPATRSPPPAPGRAQAAAPSRPPAPSGG